MEKVIGLALDDEGENWLVEHGTSACHDPKPMSAEGNSVRPVRVQRKRSKGWKMPENTVYVGRPTKWGNPFKIGEKYMPTQEISQNFTKWGLCEDNEMSVGFYKEWIKKQNYLIADIKKELKGKNLACFCPINKPCHADILLEIANRE